MTKQENPPSWARDRPRRYPGRKNSGLQEIFGRVHAGGEESNANGAAAAGTMPRTAHHGLMPPLLGQVEAEARSGTQVLFEKKEPKNFYSLRNVPVEFATSTNRAKAFLFRFFKKETKNYYSVG